MKSSIIFVEEGKSDGYERLGGQGKSCAKLLLVPPAELPQRILSAFIPPLLGPDSQKVYVDFVGPLLAVALLTLVLHIGHAQKELPVTTSPSTVLIMYLVTVPPVTVLICRLGSSRLFPRQVLALIGYSLYGPLLTILPTLLLPSYHGHSLFIITLLFFGGFTSFRLAIVLLFTIPKPAVRLLVTSLVCITHLLFIVFINFAYMHRTFVYGRMM